MGIRSVDVVVVSYNSRDRLRGCVEPLAGWPGVRAIVVDNASPEESLSVLEGLDVTTIPLDRNDGFAAGCNAGWRAGSGEYVLFLNPDARISPASLERLSGVLDGDPGVGIAAPRILEPDGSLDFSQRRFPRLRSTYAHALFLHRVFRGATWTSELVEDTRAYGRPGSPEWASGACLLVRRALLEQLAGWDDGFFMYCEDKDLCRRARNAGYDVRYEPTAVVTHEGGASAPRASLSPTLAASRIRYARKHERLLHAELERAGVALTALTHMVAGRGGRAGRAGHARALRAALRTARVA
jgi:N-acetylglucosaminyl-diphospho-decaprenol L-rhamnosyltransferase